MELIAQIKYLVSSEFILHVVSTYGILGICLVIFLETGVFALLPGDSMLVLCGMLAVTPGSDGNSVLSLWHLLLIVPAFGVLGDQVGYWLGKWFGNAVYRWKDLYFGPIPVFKRDYLRKTEGYYERLGTFTIVAGRWVPFVRTFAPLVAGVIRMPFRTFLTFNIVGAVTWVWSMVGLGVLLKMGLQALIEQYRPGFDVIKHIDIIAIIVVLLSLLPIIYTVIKERSTHKRRGRRPRRPARK